MRSIVDMATVQIEITNACHNSCSNCTRLCGHHPKPYFMDFDTFKKAVDSMVGFPKMVGIMGGEPLLHPEFEKFCTYIKSKIPTTQLGLWTCLPTGKEHYREIIVETFEHIFINDHTRDDIVHAPILVASNEITAIEDWKKDYLINKCWVQETWSASINEKGAWFCEVAAALATLFNVENLAWDVELGWWGRSPQHFVQQMALCQYCGCAMPLKKRKSIDEIDDVSPAILDILKKIGSPKIEKGKYAISDLQPFIDESPVATYKDERYRTAIAKKYGIFLMINDQCYQKPYLLKDWKKD